MIAITLFTLKDKKNIEKYYKSHMIKCFSIHSPYSPHCLKNSLQDSMASAANYIKRIGWRYNEPCFIKVNIN